MIASRLDVGIYSAHRKHSSRNRQKTLSAERVPSIARQISIPRTKQENAFRLTISLTSLHLPQITLCRLMRVLSPVDRVTRCFARGSQHYILDCSCIATLFIRKHKAEMAPLVCQGRSKEPLCSDTDSASSNQHIQQVSLLLARAPETSTLTINFRYVSSTYQPWVHLLLRRMNGFTEFFPKLRLKRLLDSDDTITLN